MSNKAIELIRRRILEVKSKQVDIYGVDENLTAVLNESTLTRLDQTIEDEVVEAFEWVLREVFGNKHEHKKLKQGRGSVGKVAVLGMRERDGWQAPHIPEAHRMKLPQGWSRRGASAKSYHHDSEGLKVARQFSWHGRDEKWHLFHNGKDTGHEFSTAREAIEHAEDARIHGH